MAGKGGGMGPMMDIIPLTKDMVPMLVGIMNQNYPRAISMYVRHFGGAKECSDAKLTDLDNEKFVVSYRAGGESKTMELQFKVVPEETPLKCITVGDARRAFVNMARHASEKLGEHIDLPPPEVVAKAPGPPGGDDEMAALMQLMGGLMSKGKGKGKSEEEMKAMEDMLKMLGAAAGEEGSPSSASAGPAARQTGVRTLHDPSSSAGDAGGMAAMMAMLGKGKGKGKGYEAPAAADPWASSGGGQRLDGGSSSAAAPAVPMDSAELVAQVKPVDPDAPSFTIRVKLLDGKAVTCTFNGSHTIAQVRAYLQVTHPDSFKGAYVLMDAGGFPPKKLSEMDQTLDAAGIKAGASLNCRKP